MTLEEACRLLDPNTTAEELAKIEYYNGFNGKKACIEAIDEACTLLVGAVRSAHHEARSGTAVDNTTGDAWTEDFTSLPAALEWLNREDKK